MRPRKETMTAPLSDQTVVLSAVDRQIFESSMAAFAARRSPSQLVKIQGITWAEFLDFLRSTCPLVVGLSDGEIEKLYVACRRIFAEYLATSSRAHWTVGSA